MSLGDFKLLYAASCVLLGLIILSPTLAFVVRLPGGERFSELYVLGSEHLAEEYPFNVSAKGVYRVFLGVGNHMGVLEDYVVYVKLRNQSDSLSDSVNGTSSSLEPLFEYRVALRDGGVWEREVSFSLDGISRYGNFCRISGLVVDDYLVAFDKVAAWNSRTGGFYYQLFFELWRLNGTVSAFEFHNRFVGVWLNVTMPT